MSTLIAENVIELDLYLSLSSPYLFERLVARVRRGPQYSKMNASSSGRTDRFCVAHKHELLALSYLLVRAKKASIECPNVPLRWHPLVKDFQGNFCALEKAVRGGGNFLEKLFGAELSKRIRPAVLFSYRSPRSRDPVALSIDHEIVSFRGIQLYFGRAPILSTRRLDVIERALERALKALALCPKALFEPAQN